MKELNYKYQGMTMAVYTPCIALLLGVKWGTHLVQSFRREDQSTHVPYKEDNSVERGNSNSASFIQLSMEGIIELY
jgi:hypothetical protein